MNTLDRSRRGQSSQRSARAQSAARFEDPKRSARAHSMARFEDSNNLYRHQSKAAAELNIQDYTMTLPASRGRHRSRIYGIKFPLEKCLEAIDFFGIAYQ